MALCLPEGAKMGQGAAWAVGRLARKNRVQAARGRQAARTVNSPGNRRVESLLQETTHMGRRRPKVGDIVEIPLSGDRKAYAHYVHWDPKMGPLIQVLDLGARDTVREPAVFASARPMFPPVITGLFAAVTKGNWRVVAHMPVQNFKYPSFVRTNYDESAGRARGQSLWNGFLSVPLGDQLPSEHRDKEFLVVWHPSNVVKRIETGEYPFPYGDLIRHGKFTPRRPSPK